MKSEIKILLLCSLQIVAVFLMVSFGYLRDDINHAVFAVWGSAAFIAFISIIAVRRMINPKGWLNMFDDMMTSIFSVGFYAFLFTVFYIVIFTVVFGNRSVEAFWIQVGISFFISNRIALSEVWFERVEQREIDSGAKSAFADLNDLRGAKQYYSAVFFGKADGDVTGLIGAAESDLYTRHTLFSRKSVHGYSVPFALLVLTSGFFTLRGSMGSILLVITCLYYALQVYWFVFIFLSKTHICVYLGKGGISCRLIEYLDEPQVEFDFRFDDYDHIATSTVVEKRRGAYQGSEILSIAAHNVNGEWWRRSCSKEWPYGDDVLVRALGIINDQITGRVMKNFAEKLETGGEYILPYVSKDKAIGFTAEGMLNLYSGGKLEFSDEASGYQIYNDTFIIETKSGRKIRTKFGEVADLHVLYDIFEQLK